MMQEAPEIGQIFGSSAYFDWSWKYCGFGQLSWYMEGDKIFISNESMDREMIRKILYEYADYIANNAVLEDG
jgi:hypothetical protein